MGEHSIEVQRASENLEYDSKSKFEEQMQKSFSIRGQGGGWRSKVKMGDS